MKMKPGAVSAYHIEIVRKIFGFGSVSIVIKELELATQHHIGASFEPAMSERTSQGAFMVGTVQYLRHVSAWIWIRQMVHLRSYMLLACIERKNLAL